MSIKDLIFFVYTVSISKFADIWRLNKIMMEIFRQFMKQNKIGKTELFHLDVKHYGSFNRDTMLYCIYEDGINLGFFAMYRHWLEYLYFADICGYTPVIRAGKNFEYQEEHAIGGTKNAFEYFFKQPSAVKVQDVKYSYKVMWSSPVHREMVELVYTGKMDHYGYTEKYMREMGEIVRKYVAFNERTSNYVNEGMSKIGIGDGKALGIHIRGTDFRGRYNNHPVFVTDQDCFHEIDRMMQKNRYDKIFVATDDQRILDAFLVEYGNLICCYHDVVRGRNNKSVAFSTSDRKNHKYLLGLEVIRDMYTLSKCDGLIAGISQVAICAQINKLSRHETYEDLCILDKGIYQNQRGFHRGGKG